MLSAIYLLWGYQRMASTATCREEHGRLPGPVVREVAILAPILSLLLVFGVYPKLVTIASRLDDRLSLTRREPRPSGRVGAGPASHHRRRVRDRDPHAGPRPPPAASRADPRRRRLPRCCTRRSRRPQGRGPPRARARAGLGAAAAPDPLWDRTGDPTVLAGAIPADRRSRSYSAGDPGRGRLGISTARLLRPLGRRGPRRVLPAAAVRDGGDDADHGGRRPHPDRSSRSRSCRSRCTCSPGSRAGGRRQPRRAMKYFLLGAFSSAFFLYGSRCLRRDRARRTPRHRARPRRADRLAGARAHRVRPARRRLRLQGRGGAVPHVDARRRTRARPRR